MVSGVMTVCSEFFDSNVEQRHTKMKRVRRLTKPASFNLLPDTPQEDEDLAKTATSRLLKNAS